MPIYEYDCAKCGRFEILQKMSAAPLKKHDVCGAKVTKMMSASSFAFKGSGFYQTDYKKQADPKKQSDKKQSDKKPSDASCASASPKNEACASCPAKDGKAA